MEKALEELARRILSLGGADSDAAAAPGGGFAAARPHASMLFCALALHSLLRAPDPKLEPVVVRLAGALRAQKTPLGSWNSWRRDAEEARACPLPDGLDVTSCALAALADTPEGIPVEWIAQFARLLTLREVGPGGPYRTWIVSEQAEAAWQGIDPVVNANIGRFLHRYGAVPEALQAFLNGAILDRARIPSSDPERTAFRYFLAGWHEGEARGALAKECFEALQDAMREASFPQLAFTLASASAFEECEADLLRAGSERLVDLCLQGDARLEAPRADAIYKGWVDGAESLLFVLALAREALAAAQRRLNTIPAVSDQPIEDAGRGLAEQVVAAARRRCESLPERLRSAAKAEIESVLAIDTAGNLTRLPFMIARAAARTAGLRDADLVEIGAAHLAGWVAYTTYDDVVDGDRETSALWAANACARLSFQAFASLFPRDAAWLRTCEDVFARMDAANLEEQEAWRLPADGPGLRFPPVLPNPSFRMLTERSLGAVLAPLALVKRTGSATEELCSRVEKFLLRLIAARQLSDDAHDWEEDLRQGRLNAVSCRMFPADRAGSLLDLDAEIEELRRVFWESLLPQVAGEVRDLCASARAETAWFLSEERNALADRLLQPLLEGMDKAIRERDTTKAFLETYRNL